MSGAPKITLRIDRIVGGPDLDRAALTAAIEAEVLRLYAAHGSEAFGTSRSLAFGRAEVRPGQAPIAARVAQATLAAVRT